MPTDSRQMVLTEVPCGECGETKRAWRCERCGKGTTMVAACFDRVKVGCVACAWEWFGSLNGALTTPAGPAPAPAEPKPDYWIVGVDGASELAASVFTNESAAKDFACKLLSTEAQGTVSTLPVYRWSTLKSPATAPPKPEPDFWVLVTPNGTIAYTDAEKRWVECSRAGRMDYTIRPALYCDEE